MHATVLICLSVLAGQSETVGDFDTHILPVLSKAGCNAGACHGAAAGRGGFHLSLLGSDPAADYDAITKALEGRRINLAKPELSLLLAKPTGRLDHGGDVVIEPDSLAEQRLLAWIRAGAPRGSPRRLTGLTASPRRIVAEALPAEVRLEAHAQFDDGSEEDVTEWTSFTVTDPDAVSIEGQSPVARVARRGQHVVMARFLGRVVPIQLIVPLADDRVDLTAEPQANFIDEEVLKLLTLLRLPVSAPAEDATFLRRASLDLTGRLPHSSLVETYLSDRDPDKRSRLIDALLSSEAFVDYWTFRLSRQLRIHALPAETAGVEAYAGWLRHQIAEGASLADMATDLLTATGDAHAIGPANFGRMVGDARQQAELAGEVFLGVRLGCANCHNHPLDRWTQDDYHGLAAIFARLERGRFVKWGSRGAVTNPRTGQPAVPRIPGDRYLEGDGDHRAALARWLREEGKQSFAKATVNGLWQAMFGRGLVEPADDLRDTNPATHPELLDRLAQDFVQSGYDLRHTLRLIALSHTYARSSASLTTNAADDRFYSRAYRRPLLPEVLVDAFDDVTGVAQAYAGHPGGTRAVKLTDALAPAPALDILGRCSRAAGCTETIRTGAGMATKLHLLNGELINDKLSSASGRLQRLIVAGKPDAEIVNEFYLVAFSRRATAAELERWNQRLKSSSAAERTRKLEDFLWSLLNSPQFINNH